MASKNPYEQIRKELVVGDQKYYYFSLPDLKDDRVDKLPHSIRVLLESALRNCDNFSITQKDVEKILNWEKTSKEQIDIPFKPARVLLQDFTGVPAVVDLAAMRDAVKRLGGNPSKINPNVPVDLVIDHSVQVDKFRTADSVEVNQQFEFNRNKERFEFLKWGAKAFEGMFICAPGLGIVHQVNLEYLARVVFHNKQQSLLYPDSLVGTDSHTTMINGLGVVGWGVGGIEAEATMLGQSISMVLPEVVGYKLVGKLRSHVTATDLVLTITQNLRKRGVVGKFVEFFGEGVGQLSIADRATISNMCPEYGATVGYFPIDHKTIEYLMTTGRNIERVKAIEAYCKAQQSFVDYSDSKEPTFSDILVLDLNTVVPCLSGPKRPHDRVPLSDVKKDFIKCLNSEIGFKGFAISKQDQQKMVPFEYEGKKYTLSHGSVVIAAITSCTNTSNPSVMLGAGLLAKKAVEEGLDVKPYVKTSLAPGSGVVSKYFYESGLQPYLDKLGFATVGYGCTTCIGNSGDLPDPVAAAINEGDIVAAAVLSGNRNFEGRVHALCRANYLGSPPLVVAYALAGRVDFDFETEPLGKNKEGHDIFLKDIWPSYEEIEALLNKYILPKFYKEVYGKVVEGTDRWNALAAPDTPLYPWKEDSTYIHNPPFFQHMQKESTPPKSIKDACVLLNLGDSITTDHISPAGSIAKNSTAAKYLNERGVTYENFNSYGARRGNDEVMVRGTFANIRLFNKFLEKPGPKTVHIPSGDIMDIYDAATKYQKDDVPLIILAGAEYGSGSSRDWAAKGVYMLGVKAVIAVSYERIHRSNLVGMGIIPLQFKAGENADNLKLTGREKFTIELPANITPDCEFVVKVSDGRTFTTICRFDTEVELTYFNQGGILPFVIRQQLH